MFLLDGKRIGIDEAFTKDDINYGNGWIRYASPEDRAAVGITEVPDPIRPDDRFYDIGWDEVANNFTKTPKDLALLKASWVHQTKATAHVRLEETDWLVIREVEEPGSMPAATKAYRKAVRARSSEIEVAINACTNVPMLEAFVNGGLNWPATESVT